MRKLLPDLVQVIQDQCGESIVYVVEYGSKKNDLDVLVGVARGRFFPFQYKAFDCIIAPIDEIDIRCKWRDIAFTDPISTGTLVYGCENKFKEFKSSLFNCSFSPDLISVYLFSRAEVEFLTASSLLAVCQSVKAIEIIEENSSKILSPVVGALDVKRQQSAFADTIGYSLSYALAARHYASSAEIVTFNDLRKTNSELDDLRNLHPRRSSCFTIELAESSLSIVRKFLLR